MLKGLTIKLVKEPLFQFLLIGAMLFFLERLANNDSEKVGNIANRVEITQQDLEGFVSLWQKTHFRMPTRDEVDTFVETRIKEEILYREALLLGLDKDDAFIRQRMAQKMTFLSEGFAGQTLPTKAELAEFYRENQPLFMTQARVSFEQIYLHPMKPDWSEKKINALLTQINDGRVDVNNAGDPSLLLSLYQDRDATSIEQQFGETFSDSLLQRPPHVWLGPFSSPFGRHLVRVIDKQPAKDRALAEIEPEVTRLLLARRSEDAERDYYLSLRAEYRVHVADIDTIIDARY